MSEHIEVNTVICHIWSDIVFFVYCNNYWYTIASFPDPCQALCTIRHTRRSPLVISFKSGTNSTCQTVDEWWIVYHLSYLSLAVGFSFKSGTNSTCQSVTIRCTAEPQQWLILLFIFSSSLLESSDWNWPSFLLVSHGRIAWTCAYSSPFRSHASIFTITRSCHVAIIVCPPLTTP